MNKKISAPIAIGIILVLAIIVGGFTWWQRMEITKEENKPLPEIEIPDKKDETAGWQTYTNKELGYEIKYPKDWNFNFSVGKIANIDKYNCSFLIYASNTIDYYANEKYCIEEESCLSSQKTINDVSFIVINVMGDNKYFSNNKDIFFNILTEDSRNSFHVGEPMPDNFFNCEPYFTQMLSTFKFIEEEEISDFEVIGKDKATGWNIGRSKKYGFEIKYPDNFRKEEDKRCIFIISSKRQVENPSLLEEWSIGNMLILGVEDYDNPSEKSVVFDMPRGAYTEITKKFFNNIEFEKTAGEDGAMGTHYKIIDYTTKKENLFFDFYFQIAYAMPMTNDKTIITQEINQEMELCDQIMSTFKFID